MVNEQRRHPRQTASGTLQITTSQSASTHSLPVKDVSKGGAFIFSSTLPLTGETISFELSDEHGQVLTTGSGQVVRVIDVNCEAFDGFAIEFDRELEQAMLDSLCTTHKDG